MAQDHAGTVETANGADVADARHGRSPVVYLRGEVDLFNVGHLRRTLLDTSTGHSSVVVDMADVTFIDGSVLGLLAHTTTRFPEGLMVRGARGMVARAFKIGGLEHLLQF